MSLFGTIRTPTVIGRLQRERLWIAESMASSPTELYLPHTLPYPIKIVSIDAATNDSVQRGTRLLSYSFVYLPTTLPNEEPKPEARFGTWDSALEGTVRAWNLAVGDVISHKKAKDRPALVIIEPCKHGMQLGGLCVLCGKDMTKYVPLSRFLDI